LSACIRVRAKIVVINNPVPDAKEISGEGKASARKSWNIQDGQFIVGFARRFVETKGLRKFLYSMKIASEVIDLYFVIAGQGPENIH